MRISRVLPTLPSRSSSISSATAQVQDDDMDAQNSTAFAITYGWPLLAYQEQARGLVAQSRVNQFFHARALVTAETQTVVRSNTDTIYSSLAYDLSKEDLIIDMPDVPQDQFVLVAYYGPYGNCFALTGTGHETNAGKFRLRKRPERVAAYGVRPRRRPFINGVVADVVSPSTYGTVLVRWLVNTTNLESIHQWQDSTSAETVSRRCANEPEAPELTSLLSYNMTGNKGDDILSLLAGYYFQDGPLIPSDSETVEAHLRAAGITPGEDGAQGSYEPVAGVDTNAAYATAIGGVTEAAKRFYSPLNNGWAQPKLELTGIFGADYEIRALIAMTAYLMLPAPDAVYPNHLQSTGASSSIQLGADEAVVYTFSGKPPIQETGFWSLSAYEDDYLIDNPLDRYSLGDRSNLTYADGSPVYGEPGNDGSSGSQSFSILFQPSNIPPPSNWTSNWLPGPVGGGNCQLMLRWYGAENELLDGTYVYPVVTRQAAIRE